jgi:ribosomal protein S18 acetylase RimI-like enzyme
MWKKIRKTLTEIKKTSHHHYGPHPSSIIKFLYYSAFRINYFLLFEKNLAEEIPDISPDPEFQVIIPTMAELDTLRGEQELPREFFYDRIHNVKTCFLALHQGEIAYIHWVYFKGDYSRFLNLTEGSAEINYATTLPKFRGRNLSGKMFALSTRYLKDRGIKRVYMLCHVENPPIIKSFKKAGYREIRRIISIGPFNRRINV